METPKFDALLAQLPHKWAGHYVVAGSGAMAAAGLRDVNDLDLLADAMLWVSLGMGLVTPDGWVVVPPKASQDSYEQKVLRFDTPAGRVDVFNVLRLSKTLYLGFFNVPNRQMACGRRVVTLATCLSIKALCSQWAKYGDDIVLIAEYLRACAATGKDAL